MLFKNGADYDQRLPVWNKGIPMTEEQKQKHCLAMANRDLSYITDEYREKLRKTQKEYRANESAEQRARRAELLSKTHKGKKPSAETRAKLSAALKGKKPSAEAIAKKIKSQTKIYYGKSVYQWAEELGVSYYTVRGHLKNGDFLEWKEKIKKDKKNVK